MGGVVAVSLAELIAEKNKVEELFNLAKRSMPKGTSPSSRSCVMYSKTLES